MTRCNQDCGQGRRCKCREPFIGSTADIALAIVTFVFALSSLAYLFGGFR